MAANLARNGIVALARDLGQGERFQNYDPELGVSKAGETTGEHGHANVQTLLIGEHVSRYFIWDAMRGVDYLTSRKDVDGSRIGAFGCSGGGTVTAALKTTKRSFRRSRQSKKYCSWFSETGPWFI